MRTARHCLLRLATTFVLGIGGLCGCASQTAAAAGSQLPSQPTTASAGSGPGPWRYRCDSGLEFNVRFGDGAATLEERPGGSQVLLRDAGGATPSQTVYANERLRVEFGLGESGREAIVREAGAADGVHCMAQ